MRPFRIIPWLCVVFAGVLAAADHQSGVIVNLYDAFGKPVPGTELSWGYSVLIRFQGKSILFDSGGDADKFARNTRALGVDLKSVDYAVLSHSHGDHASGFDYAFKENPALKLYIPDDRMLGAGSGLRLPVVPREVLDSLAPGQRYFNGEEKSTTGPWGSRYWGAHTEAIGATKEIAPGVFLIHTISPLMGDFSRAHAGDPPDLVGLRELSLALVTSKGTVLVTGCSHSGIESILRETKKVLPKDFQLVIGGFHLLPNSASEIQQLAHTMKEDLGVRQVAPAHCTGMLAFKIFRDIYGNDFISAGLASRVPFTP
jgi:7,8-dihydropterin-6-yl-methyl-4-(beta-D-ribofuranosyl)aminobenzene 5'-phosphate synthase